MYRKSLILLFAVAFYGVCCAEYQTTLDLKTQKYAEETLGETSDVRDKALEEISKWIMSNTSKFTMTTDPIWLLSFLRVNKFDIEKTKQYIMENLKFRASAPEWFTNRDPNNPPLRKLLKQSLVVPLRGRDKHGRVVVIMRVAAYNPMKYDMTDFLKVLCTYLDILISEEEDAAVNGLVFIADMENFGISHVAQITPNIITKGASLWTTYNFRAEGLEYFNVPTIVNVVVSLFKSVLPTKFRHLLRVHEDGVQVHHIIPKSILPMEYGGINGTLKEMANESFQKCIEKRDWLIESEKWRTHS